MPAVALSTSFAQLKHAHRAPASSTKRSGLAVLRAEGSGSDSYDDEPIINRKVRKDDAKVVDTVKASNIKGKQPYCRCFMSGTFPQCDGSHAKHNERTGDNVGPLIISS